MTREVLLKTKGGRGAHRLAAPNPAAISAADLFAKYPVTEVFAPELDAPDVYSFGTARASSFSWAVFGRIGVQGVQLVGTLVLGRIVAPSQFGIFAAAMFVVALGSIFNDLGIGPAIVQRQRLDDHFLRAAFWLNAAIGVVLWLLTVALAYPLSRWYGYSALEYVVPLLGLCFALSFSSVGFALLERRYRLKTIVMIEFVAILGGQLCAIGVSLADPSVVAVALSPVVATVLMSLGALTLSGWRPGWRPRVRRADLKEIRGYVSYVSLFNITSFAARNSDDFFLGRHVSSSSLGYYSRSYQLMLLPVTQVTVGMARVLRPAFAQSKDDRRRLEKVHTLAEVGAVAIGVITGVAFFAAAPSAVPVVLGPKWEPIVRLVQIFAISLPTQMVAAVNGALYQATANVRLLLASGAFNSLVLVVAFVFVSGHGITAVAITFVIYSYATLPVAVLPICRRLGLAVTPALTRVVAVVGVGAILYGLMALLPDVIGLSAPGPAKLAYQVGALLVFCGLVAVLIRTIGLDRIRRVAEGSGRG